MKRLLGTFISILDLRQNLLAKIWPKTEKVWNNTKATGYVKGIFVAPNLALKILKFLIKYEKVILPGFWNEPEKLIEHFSF